MPNNEVYLPAEILHEVFSYLESDDIVASSGVNTWWYKTAQSFLASRSGIHLTRWAELPPTSATTLCIAGHISVENIPKTNLKKLKCVSIHYDEPAPLDEHVLHRILRKCEHLNRLELLNLTTIKSQQVEDLLNNSNLGLKLRLKLHCRRKTTRLAVNLLEEHRELFSEITIEYEKSKMLVGWFPVLSDDSQFHLKSSTASVILNCPGLQLITCSPLSKVKYLKLSNASQLCGMNLLTLSRLPLHALEIDGLTATEQIWLLSFKTGFSSIKRLSLTNCQNVTDAVLEIVGNKRLRKLKLDLNKGASERSGIPHLYKIKTLEHLHVNSSQILTDAVFEGVKNHWPNLKYLHIEDSIFGYNTVVETIDCIRNYLQTMPYFRFTHNTLFSKIQDNIVLKTAEF